MNILFKTWGSSSGNNSALLVVPSTSGSHHEGESLAQHLSDEFKVFLLDSELPAVNSVTEYAAEVVNKLVELGVRRIAVLGLSAGGSLTLALAVESPKLVRRVILVNPTTRIAPGLFSRVIDRLEEFLPLGLPLRKISRAFDARSTLHRIHCPVLVLNTRTVDEFHRYQAELIAQRIPNAWLKGLEEPEFNSAGVISSELAKLIRDFVQVPGKRPQKNLPSETAHS